MLLLINVGLQIYELFMLKMFCGCLNMGCAVGLLNVPAGGCIMCIEGAPVCVLGALLGVFLIPVLCVSVGEPIVPTGVLRILDSVFDVFGGILSEAVAVLGVPVGVPVAVLAYLLIKCTTLGYFRRTDECSVCTNLARYLSGTTLVSFISAERQRQQDVTFAARFRLGVIRQHHTQTVHL